MSAKLHPDSLGTRRQAAARVRELRQAAGLTQEQVEQRFGIVNARSLRDIEAGRVSMAALELVIALENYPKKQKGSSRWAATPERTARGGHESGETKATHPVASAAGARDPAFSKAAHEVARNPARWASGTGAELSPVETTAIEAGDPALLRGRAVVARQAHNLEVEGAIPSLATGDGSRHVTTSRQGEAGESPEQVAPDLDASRAHAFPGNREQTPSGAASGVRGVTVSMHRCGPSTEGARPSRSATRRAA